MPPILAFLLCCGFVAWLIREDIRWRRLESRGLWIAGLYLGIIGSRSPTYWTAYVGLGGRAESTLEGSPINFLIPFVLIVGAVFVLRQRGLKWSAVVRTNKALFLIYIFFAFSALWAEYPFVSLRRLFKDFGVVPIAFLLLTEMDPAAAIRTIYVRVSFVLFPFSILLYKYFPELGRQYSHDGEPLFAGVCTTKNELGQTLIVFSLILLWDLIELRKEETSECKKRQVFIHYGCLLMSLWLLIISHSMTSMICLSLGSLLWWGGRYLGRLRSPFQVLGRVLAVGLCLVAFNAMFRPSRMALEAVGRDVSLTGRADAWPIMLELCKDPLLGDGYRMFWDVSRAKVYELTDFNYPSAHNGYLETYLAGGLLGLGLLGLFLLASGLRVAEGLLGTGSFGILGFVFWVLLLVYNWTESNFIWGELLWFTFLLWAVKPRSVEYDQVVARETGCENESSEFNDGRTVGLESPSEPVAAKLVARVSDFWTRGSVAFSRVRRGIS